MGYSNMRESQSRSSLGNGEQALAKLTDSKENAQGPFEVNYIHERLVVLP